MLNLPSDASETLRTSNPASSVLHHALQVECQHSAVDLLIIISAMCDGAFVPGTYGSGREYLVDLFLFERPDL